MLASSREPRAAANARGRDKSLPYESEQTVRPTGKCKPCMIANPCRGRFYIGPGTPRCREPGGYLRPKSRTYGPVGLRNAPAGAVESAPTQVSRVGNARRSRSMWYIRNDRRAGCPHPAAPRAAANTRGRDLRPKSRRCAAVGLRNAPAGAVNPSPTARNKRRGQPEKREHRGMKTRNLPI